MEYNINIVVCMLLSKVTFSKKVWNFDSNSKSICTIDNIYQSYKNVRNHNLGVTYVSERKIKWSVVSLYMHLRDAPDVDNV